MHKIILIKHNFPLSANVICQPHSCHHSRYTELTFFKKRSLHTLKTVRISVCAYVCVCGVLAHWVGQVLSVRELCRYV